MMQVRHTLEYLLRKKVEAELETLQIRLDGHAKKTKYHAIREACFTADLGPISSLGAIGVTGHDRWG